MDFKFIDGTLTEGNTVSYAIPDGYTFAGSWVDGNVVAVDSIGAMASVVYRFHPQEVPGGVTTLLAVTDRWIFAK